MGLSQTPEELWLEIQTDLYPMEVVMSSRKTDSYQRSISSSVPEKVDISRGKAPPV